MRSDPQLVKGTVRLLILTLLDREAMYGYQMIQYLEHRSEGYFRVGEGAPYPLLHEMEHEGMLRAKWLEQGNRRRRYYRVTARGRRELARRLGQWRGLRRAITLVTEVSHV
jgi:DNA-binding PadR family transcriptional regulator